MNPFSKHIFFKPWIVLSLGVFFTAHVHSQKSFDVLLPLEKEIHDSQLFDVYPDSEYIFFIGEFLDTTFDTIPKERMYWGAINYEGELVKRQPVEVPGITNQIGVYGSRILINSKGNLVYIPILYNDHGWAECFPVEIDPETGEVTKFNILPNFLDPLSYIVPSWVEFHRSQANGYLLSTVLEFNDNRQCCLLVLDSNFTVTKTILVDDNGRDNYVVYATSETDSTYVLIGDSRKKNDTNEAPDVKPFYMLVNQSGHIMDFRLATGIPDKSVGFFLAENHSPRQDQEGNWIFSAHSFFPGWHSIPYVFSYNHDFTKMNWASCFSEDKLSTTQTHNILSADYDPLHHSYITIGTDGSLQPENNSYIYKVRDNGDSLWLRHYIPLAWTPEDVVWATLQDIKISPYNTYVAVGRASSWSGRTWRSWVMQVDTNGCFVPGCELVGVHDNEETGNRPSFLFYPNPCHSLLGILCQQDIQEEIKVFLFNEAGEFIKQSQFQPVKGYQYVLDVGSLPGGVYFISLQRKNSEIVQVEKIIKL